MVFSVLNLFMVRTIFLVDWRGETPTHWFEADVHFNTFSNSGARSGLCLA